MWYSGLSLGFGIRGFGCGFESSVALSNLSNLSEPQFPWPQMGVIPVIHTSPDRCKDQMKN